MKATPEGSGNLLDSTCCIFVHEHAEANDHKNNGLSVIVAGHASKIRTGAHTRTTGTIADLYTAVANKTVGAGIRTFPSGSRELTEIFS
jgi:4-hydroxy-3-methylbut-2-enyl diphosphate reductase IspH